MALYVRGEAFDHWGERGDFTAPDDHAGERTAQISALLQRACVWQVIFWVAVPVVAVSLPIIGLL